MCVRFPDYATTEVVEQRQEQLGQEGPRRFVILQLLLWLSPLPSAPLSPPPHHHPLTHLSPHPSAPSISSSTFHLDITHAPLPVPPILPLVDLPQYFAPVILHHFHLLLLPFHHSPLLALSHLDRNGSSVVIS